MSDVSPVENDLRAIEALNQRDVQFALAVREWNSDPGSHKGPSVNTNPPLLISPIVLTP